MAPTSRQIVSYEFSGIVPPSRESFGVCDFPAPIDRLVLAINGRRRDDGWIALHVAPGGSMESPWMLVACWGTPIVDPFARLFADGPPPAPAEWRAMIDEEYATSDDEPTCEVDVDTIKFREPTHTARWRLRWHGDHPPQIVRLIACGWRAEPLSADNGRPDDSLPVIDPTPVERVEFATIEPPPYLSQFQAGTDRDGHLCGPTALAMVVGAFGYRCSVIEAAQRAFDPLSGLFGNWTALAAAASEFSLIAWIERHTTVDDLRGLTGAGLSIICSVSYRRGELPGAPVPESAGHLLVVRGVEDSAVGPQIFVHDPAGKNDAEGIRHYPLEEFAKAWLGHGGIAIHIEPERGL